jgi:hypothetical protein
MDGPCHAEGELYPDGCVRLTKINRKRGNYYEMVRISEGCKPTEIAHKSLLDQNADIIKITREQCALMNAERLEWSRKNP